MSPSNPSTFDLCRPGVRIKQQNSGFENELIQILSLVESEFQRAVASCFAYAPVCAKTSVSSGLSSHTRALRSIFAREFVLSLDSISKILAALAKTPDCSELVRGTIDKYQTRFDFLKHIRDSFAHIEDRGRGLSRNGDQLPTNVIVIETFINDDFVFSGSDGVSRRVEISTEVLRSAHDLVQEIINGFEWEGPIPRR